MEIVPEISIPISSQIIISYSEDMLVLGSIHNEFKKYGNNGKLFASTSSKSLT